VSTLAGRVLGEHRLVAPIGSGALGESFRAENVRGDGRVAVIKVMHGHLASDPTFAERFRRAVEAAAALHHPHVVTITDFGQRDGQFYIVMELVPDGSLRTLLQRRDRMLPLRRGVEFARQMAGALAFVHSQGLVHRDVKPENVLVRLSDTDRDMAKLADVGLTRLTESGVTVGGNMALGSYAYMAPEQCRGLQPTAQSDLYSLGIVLYEMATGYPPFQVRTLADALTKHTSAPPPPPRSLVRDLPAELERIILRCLAKTPAERWASAGELERALQAVVAGMPALPVVNLAGPAAAGAGSSGAGSPGGGPVVVMRDGSSPRSQAPAQPAGEPGGPAGPRGRYRVQLDSSAGAPADSPPAPRPAGMPASGMPPVPEGGRIKVSMDAERRMRPTIPDEPRPEAAAPAAPAESKRIRVALDRTAINLTPGQPAIFTVTLNNSGRTVDHYTLSAEGVPEGWVKAPPQGPQLNPGQRSTVPLTVLVPRSAESLAGDYPIVIRARSRDNPNESGTARAVWSVQPFAQSLLTLAPSRVRGWRRASLRATLRNQGNVAARYSLSGADEEQLVRWEFAEPQVPLEPGQSVSVRARGVASLRLLGSSENRPFTVRAEPVAMGGAAPMAEPPLVAAGQFVHRALIPTWLPPLLLLVGAALFFLLRDRHQIQIAVQPAAAQVAIGGTTVLAAAVTNAKSEAVPDAPVSWESKDSTIARVSDSGVVRGLREGSTLIVARTGKRMASAQIAVVAARVEAVVLTPKAINLKQGASATFRALAKDGSGVGLRRDFTWQSSDPTVVTVGGNGKVTAKGPGVATVTAMAEGKSATADVTVAELPPGQVAGEAADCVNYDPAPLKVAADRNTGWVLTDGAANLLTLDNESDARKALALAGRYKSHCFLGRANSRPNRSDYVIEYWEAPTSAPTVIDAEDCVRYDRAALRIVEQGAQGFVLTDQRSRLLAADTQKDAQKAWDIAQKHAMLCFIGRGNRRVNQRDYIVQYWK
jgi:hypothetical protein